MFISKTKLLLAVLAMALIVPTTAFAAHSWPDVDDGRFYADAVEWAKGNGMTTGCDGGTNFCPERGVTRGENITFAKRYDDLVVQPALEAIDTDIATNAGEIEDNATDIANLPDVYFIEVEADGTKTAGSFGTSVDGHSSTGLYELDWPVEVDDCVWQASIAQKRAVFGDAFDDNDGEVSLRSDFDFFFVFVLDADGMTVETRNSAGVLADRPFHVTVTCGLPTLIFIPPILPPIIVLP